jgi:hypothetical protein
VQARSHLLHLREGFLETRGRSDALSLLVVESAPAFAALVASLARLDPAARANGTDAAAAARHLERSVGVSDGTIAAVVALARAHDLSSDEGERLFARYFEALKRIVAYVDGWSDGR